MPSAEELARTGLTPDDYTEALDIWPENWDSWLFWLQIHTQWRVGGLGGLIGLDYTPVLMLMEKLHLTEDGWKALWSDVRAMEAAVLNDRASNG